VPKEIMTGEDITSPRVVTDPRTGRRAEIPGAPPTPISPYLTLLTSMFMHGSIMHLVGNMLFLWIFGDNVEDTLGHVRYVLFYLLTGLIASLTHVASTIVLFGLNSQAAEIPSLGASGAISGVMGGYILLFPHRRVTVLLFRFLTEVPAWVAVGIWFAFQVIESVGVLGRDDLGGVAYGAHIGGFIAGVVLVKAFAIGHSRTPERHIDWSHRRRR
jgi:membrane associated rhomboid family serine protease